ncbi:hypothetical protein Q5424_10220 [Conexibacter sp. JD483]|uniref:hypothetical protein n=1 Tax=unclassified Conexibacter TaxID=2627773 RepID=UPI0027221ABD|nr:MULTISPECIES: hypothetical protein [unclassified Conexibacter]MDO8188319.1 hypothetical protein [Conexibacter sp. CPCC 205706]MDO8200733.1 hypothetical protein [Conexibacter sp. CPCC 205762]MDR9369457.1 hypothetical protein [Conexibacter sp. JD483]
MAESPVSARNQVLAALQQEPGLTDGDIESVTGLSHSKASHARVGLWRDGLIARAGQDERRRWLWECVTDERRDYARTQHRDAMERRLRDSLDKKPVEQRAAIAFHLLLNDDVDSSMRDLFSRQRHWRRAQAAANNVRREKEADRRARRKAMRDAADDDALLAFLTIRDRIRNLIDALFVLRQQLDDDRARLAEGEPTRISIEHWGDVHRNVHEVLLLTQVIFKELVDTLDLTMDSCPVCGARLVHDVGSIAEGYVEGEIVEEEGLLPT